MKNKNQEPISHCNIRSNVPLIPRFLWVKVVSVAKNQTFLPELKGLSSEMDPAQIRLIP
jgi:hypothetical protein